MVPEQTIFDTFATYDHRIKFWSVPATLQLNFNNITD